MSTVRTSNDFWDCQCEEHFIHLKADRLKCPLCLSEEPDGMPDSRLAELGYPQNMFNGRGVVLYEHAREMNGYDGNHIVDKIIASRKKTKTEPYEFVIGRTGYGKATIKVSAATMDEAEQLAYHAAYETEFPDDDSSYEIESCKDPDGKVHV